ncbi:MAG: methyltransferase domain-containing protein [Pirellulaceae bacterium]
MIHARPASVPIPDEHQLGQYIPLHYHYNMLLDSDRVGAFQLAIEKTVSPDMHVVELGGGTGILSSFAARRGASVTCVERNPVLAERAAELLRDNGLSYQTEVLNEDAMTFIPNRPVDVVICEMLHVGLLREKQLQVIDAFKHNYRRAFGATVSLPTFIPEASVLMWQPINQSFDFAGYWAPVPMFQAPRLADPRTTEVGPLDPYASIDYADDFSLQFHCRQSVAATVDLQVNAVRMITQNVLAIDEPNQTAVTWPNQCLILPLHAPIQPLFGQQVKIAFDYQAGDPLEILSQSLSLELT